MFANLSFSVDVRNVTKLKREVKTMQIAQEMPAQWRARHRGTEWEWVWESKWRQWRQQKKFDGNAGKEGKEDEDEHDDVTWCECRWQGKILKISYYEVDDNEARAIIHKQSLKFRAPLIGDWSLLCSSASECIFPECLQWRELPIVAGLPLTIFFGQIFFLGFFFVFF